MSVSGALAGLRRRWRHEVFLNAASLAGAAAGRLAAPSGRGDGGRGAGAISLEGSCLERRVSGVERYVDCLLRAMAAEAPEREFVLYTRVPHLGRAGAGAAADGNGDGESPPNVSERTCGPHGRYLARQAADLASGRIALHHVTWQDFFLHHDLPLRHARRSVLTVHDLINLLEPDYHPAWERRRYRRTLRRATAWADRVLVGSEATRDELLRELGADPARIRVVPYGVDERFGPQRGTAEHRERVRAYGVEWGEYVFCLAKCYAHKNLETLVDAHAALVRARGERAPALLLAGERYWQPTVRSLRERIRAAGLEQSVRWVEHVAEADLPLLYAGASVFAFPSRREGFGLPVLEAMACGTAVVCARAASLPEVTGDAALHFDPGEPGELCRLLGSVLDDVELRRGLEEDGRRRAARFPWSETARRTLAVYDEVLSGSRS